MGNARRTHEGLDPKVAAAMQWLYEHTIEFGGHPNQQGVAASLRIDRPEPDVTTIGVGILHPEPRVLVAALKSTVDVAAGIAKTVSLIYPERFRIVGLDDEIERFARDAYAVFSRHAQALRSVGPG